MDITPEIWAQAHELVARNTTSSSPSASNPNRPPIYKAIGLTLAVCSGLFIGTSFVFKKMGLLKANKKYNEEAGEGYGYLKNAWWWTGMTLMIVGEICNFVAYAFVDAILVTPLGALSVVVTTILSAIFLKERLSFVGKVGCFGCIIGSVVIVMNAPEQSAVSDIQEMKHFVIAPGFLSYAGVIIVGSAFIALWVGPRYGKKSMLVYLSICSLIGGLSVVATQGLGSAIVAQAGGKPQFNQWFLYVLLVFVVATLVTEIIFLNVSQTTGKLSTRANQRTQKALNLFNAALVTPTYYVFFTSATIITSAVLFQGFKGTAIGIATVIMGFLQICAGVVLLQLSKSAKDVPDAAVFKGDLDQVREVAEVEQPESEPKADAIRGGASILRRISQTRQKLEHEEAKRVRQDTLKDRLEPVGENEIVEWDGLRRRKTVVGSSEAGTPVRRKTLHPPLGMSRFPNSNDENEGEESHFFDNLRTRAQTLIHPQQARHAAHDPSNQRLSPIHPVALTEINVHPSKPPDTPIIPYGPGSLEDAQEHIYGYQPHPLHQNISGALSPRSKPLPTSPRPQASTSPRGPPQTNRRQFSFTSLFHRDTRQSQISDLPPPPSRQGLGSRQSSQTHEQKRAMKNATEEERLGLVKGDSHSALLSHEHSRSPPRHDSQKQHLHSSSSSTASESYAYDDDDFDDVEKIPSSHYPDRNTNPPASGSDKDDEWQMTTPPPRASPPSTTNTRVPLPANPRPNVRSPSPPRPTTRRRPSPPIAYHQPLPQAPTPAATARQPAIATLAPQSHTPGLISSAPRQPQTYAPVNSGREQVPPRIVLGAPVVEEGSGLFHPSSTSRSLTATTSTRDDNPVSGSTGRDEDYYNVTSESSAHLVRVESPEEYESRGERLETRRPGGAGNGAPRNAFL